MPIIVTEPVANPAHDRLCGQCGRRHTKYEMTPVAIDLTHGPRPAMTRFDLCGHVARMVVPED